MRPMTAREALEIERSRAITDSGQARRILDALVEFYESWDANTGKLTKAAMERFARAEDKLASLERGEEPQA